MLRQIARLTNFCGDSYRDNARVRAGVNTAGIFLGTRLVGYLAGMKSDELEQIINMAAPVGAGIYASIKASNDEVISSDGVRSVAKVAIAGLVGWDLSGHLVDYDGNVPLVEMLRDGYAQVHNYVANNVTHYHEPSSTGTLAGLVGGAIARVIHYKRVEREEA